ncbi:hypothetical protein [Paenibacillus sp. y28]|uniref:hypothetical protein n=1 Tax=Paenibacillus sp. y28 TaxID=3129110 RepID=UPI003017F720
MFFPTILEQEKQKLEQLLKPSHTLCREDLIWILEYVKKKVAEKDPLVLGLPQPRLLMNFHYFSEIAMLLIHRRYTCGPEVETVRAWVKETLDGLTAEDEGISRSS